MGRDVERGETERSRPRGNASGVPSSGRRRLSRAAQPQRGWRAVSCVGLHVLPAPSQTRSALPSVAPARPRHRFSGRSDLLSSALPSLSAATVGLRQRLRRIWVVHRMRSWYHHLGNFGRLAGGQRDDSRGVGTFAWRSTLGLVNPKWESCLGSVEHHSQAHVLFLGRSARRGDILVRMTFVCFGGEGSWLGHATLGVPAHFLW